MRLLLTTLIVLATALPAAAQTAPVRYEAALAREKQIRATKPAAAAIRRVVAQYEAIAARYPRSGYSDNALWQASGLAYLSLQRHGSETDRRTAVRLLQQLRKSYPGGTLAKQVPSRLKEISGWSSSSARRAIAQPSKPPVERAVDIAPEEPEPSAEPELAAPTAAKVPNVLTAIVRSALPSGERLTITMNSEPQYTEERILGPERLFFDFRDTAADTAALPGNRLAGGVVRDIRLGARPEQTTRLVIELEPDTRHSVFALYNPYRLVVDLERTAGPAAPAPAAAPAAPVPPASRGKAASPVSSALPVTTGAPTLPAANANGSFSLSRQLGLGVARIVIDAGHGGHDPGASANRVVEKDLVLDIALRLEKLLLEQPGIEVVLTRRDDSFVELEERTRIANRENADLFLSIHANVARNKEATGIETYFLNFATNPEAEAVAARENAGSGMAMHSLPDIVRKIALNNKLDESRDLATAVQSSLYRRLQKHNASTRNRGVKQAPFVVLIGAEMPSVLAEVSFITNRNEAALLRTVAYRQQIARSLFDAVVKYRQSLKQISTVASGTETR
ncbi:MAG: N-acetylmuramoyl-L-alanine amidase [Acidobacteriota bacterium]|nr:N-acetylmuramoyl-L-alanine amidase [Acidobacteriota bacterium]